MMIVQPLQPLLYLFPSIFPPSPQSIAQERCFSGSPEIPFQCKEPVQRFPLAGEEEENRMYERTRRRRGGGVGNEEEGETHVFVACVSRTFALCVSRRRVILSCSH